MIAVSPGDWSTRQLYPDHKIAGAEPGSVVRKAEDSAANASSLVVVREAKSGDGERRGLSYPECSLMRGNRRSNMNSGEC